MKSDSNKKTKEKGTKRLGIIEGEQEEEERSGGVRTMR
jgi:hypothetical protein